MVVPKWDVYYSEEGLAFQKDFFDHFLKGIENGFESRSSVRLEVRETLNDYEVRYEEDWPIPRTDYQALYLHAATNVLTSQESDVTAITQYDSKTGQAVFSHIFDEDTELTGNMKLKLWVSIAEGSDMDLFVGVEKLDLNGEPVHFYAKTGYKNGSVAMGWLRASQRTLDPKMSTPWQPVLLHDNPKPISPGDIIPVEIEILPSSTLFRAGETLRLTVKGRDLFDHPALAHEYSVNRGEHRIQTGNQYDSHLLVPVIARD